MYIWHSTVVLVSTSSVPVVPVAVPVAIVLVVLLVIAAVILGVVTVLCSRHNGEKNGMYMLGL